MHISIDKFWYRNQNHRIKQQEESISSKWINWMSTCRRMQTNPGLALCKKLKSKWGKDLNINPDALNIVKEKLGTKLEWDLMKLQRLGKAKDIADRTKWNPRDWERIFTYPILDRVLISKMYKELKKLDTNNPYNPI